MQLAYRFASSYTDTHTCDAIVFCSDGVRSMVCVQSVRGTITQHCDLFAEILPTEILPRYILCRDTSTRRDVDVSDFRRTFSLVLGSIAGASGPLFLTKRSDSCRKMGCQGLQEDGVSRFAGSSGRTQPASHLQGCSTFPHPLNKRGPGVEKTPTITTVRTGLGPGQPRSEGGGATRGNPSSACAQELRYPGRRVNVYMLGNRAATSIARFKGSP